MTWFELRRKIRVSNFLQEIQQVVAWHSVRCCCCCCCCFKTILTKRKEALFLHFAACVDLSASLYHLRLSLIEDRPYCNSIALFLAQFASYQQELAFRRFALTAVHLFAEESCGKSAAYDLYGGDLVLSRTPSRKQARFCGLNWLPEFISRSKVTTMEPQCLCYSDR